MSESDIINTTFVIACFCKLSSGTVELTGEDAFGTGHLRAQGCI